MDDNLADLTSQFEQATAAKLKCQQEAEATASTISLANRYTHTHTHTPDTVIIDVYEHITYVTILGQAGGGIGI